MNIAGLVRSSTVDYPGHLAAVVFSPGCNLDCFYCHNRMLLTGTAPHLDEEEVQSFLRKRSGLLEGVVCSGGEPTLQQGLPDFIRKVRALGYKIKLDTNGTRPTVLEKLLSEALVDYVAIDYKAPWNRYAEFCDCSADDVQHIQTSLQLLQGTSIDWEVRTTVIPQLGLEDLAAMARSLPTVPLYVLQRYLKPALHRKEDRFRLDAIGHTPAQLVLFAEHLRADQPHILVR